MKKKHLWSYHSDQPLTLSSNEKKRLRKNNGLVDFKLLIASALLYPSLFIRFLLGKTINNKKQVINPTEFYALAVNLDKGNIQHQLVEELGVKSLLIRVYLSDMNNIDDYVGFAKGFGDDKSIIIQIIQDTPHINDHQLLIEDVATIFTKFAKISNEFIIGNAPNRIKWGFVSIDAYLAFYQSIQTLRDNQFSHIKLIGSSIIDFEYHFTIRTLFNGYNIHYDIVGSQLYVDRRGSPKSKQYGIFDLKNKIHFLWAIVTGSKKASDRIYITETNYPLRDRGLYKPTSEVDCVDEFTQAEYLTDYYQIAKNTGRVERVYWHQLIAPGYGLVDNRDGVIRKMPSFYAFKSLCQGENNK
jgi:hypothetical protein